MLAAMFGSLQQKTGGLMVLYKPEYFSILFRALWIWEQMSRLSIFYSCSSNSLSTIWAGLTPFPSWLRVKVRARSLASFLLDPSRPYKSFWATKPALSRFFLLALSCCFSSSERSSESSPRPSDSCESSLRCFPPFMVASFLRREG